MTDTHSPSLDALPVLNCNLFGEAGDLPDVVHCETIETRSKLHDWEFAPHRHARLHQVLLVHSGGGKAAMEGETSALSPMTMVNVPLGCVHGFTFTPGTIGWVVTIAAEMIDEALEPSEGLRPVLARPAVLPATEPIRAIMEQIFGEYAGRDFARAQVLRALTGVLLGHVARSLSQHGLAAESTADSGIFRRFETLIEEHFLDRWPVADYASALGVTPTHLSRVARAAVGQPATRVIEDRMIREARRNLVYTNLPVSRIAYTLGYNDPAYFSRVFSQATGMSPRDFRERVEHERAAG
ncbi:MAG: helix-turn-helix domain-containing protein [Oricola sp.]